MKLFRYILSLIFLFVLPSLASAQALPDSLLDDDEKVDSSLITRRNIAKDFNYLDHILDGRYLAQGDQFTKRWNDHLFIEAGLGVQQVVAPTDTYGFTPTNMAKLALGKQFNPKHSLRFSLYGTYAYQKKQEFFMYQIGAKLDHIFDMSSYFAGYDPTRRLSVSTIVGIGAVRSQFAQNQHRKKESATAFEGHLGLQFKIFAGPQGYINIEPYAGLSTDPIDISKKRNWRDYDAFYGANISYVYYLRNNLSPEARMDYLTKRILKDELTADSALFSWRKPMFIEMSNSVHFLESPELSAGATMGGGYSLGLGGWLSPAIALRGTLSNENVVYQHTQNSYGSNDAQAGNYLSARAEAMLNPFGFVRHYNWDSPFGVYAIAGMEVGKLWKRLYDVNKTTAYFQGYTAGLHLWARMSDGLQFFVEPRFEHVEYHKPNNKKTGNWRYSDNLWSVNMGVTVFTKTRKYTDWKLWEESDQSQFMNKLVIGIGGGVNYLQKKVQFFDTNFKLGYNVNAFAEYHFSARNAIRLSGDAMMHPLKIALNDRIPERQYGTALFSLDYMMNLTNYLNSQDPDLRTFEAFAFVGPTMLMGVSRDEITKPTFTGNVGVKLLYHINRHFGIHLTPTFYYLHNQIKHKLFPEQSMSNISVLETINAGVQYTF